MKNNSLDDIVKCNIDISSPASNDATFDSILIVVPGPEAAGAKTMVKTTAISQADELLDYGFTTNDTAYLAATAAFSQNPAPSELLICIRKETSEEGAAEVVYEDMKITLARANGEAQFYGIHITEFKDPADVQATIEWTETQEKIFGFEYAGLHFRFQPISKPDNINPFSGQHIAAEGNIASGISAEGIDTGVLQFLLLVSAECRRNNRCQFLHMPGLSTGIIPETFRHPCKSGELILLRLFIICISVCFSGKFPKAAEV